MGRYLYKLTDEQGNTRKNTHWDVGTKHEVRRELRICTHPLCTSSYIHAYENPLVAVLMNPIHANFKAPILWRAVGWVSRREGELKCGCFSLRIIEKLPLPEISVAQRIRIGIYSALSICSEPDFVLWAKNWLAGTDRTVSAAATAANAYVANASAASAVAYAAAYANATAAYATAAAANASAYAAFAYAASATAASAYAANASAAAAAANAVKASNLNLIKIIKRAMKEEK